MSVALATDGAHSRNEEPSEMLHVRTFMSPSFMDDVLRKALLSTHDVRQD